MRNWQKLLLRYIHLIVETFKLSKTDLSNEKHTILLEDKRIAYLSLPVPLTLAEKDRLKKYIDMAVSIVCLD